MMKNSVLLLVAFYVGTALGSPFEKVSQFQLKARYNTQHNIRSLSLAVDIKLGKIVVSSTLNRTKETNIYNLKEKLWYKINGLSCNVTTLEGRSGGDPYFPFDLNEANSSKLIENLFYLFNATKQNASVEEYAKTGLKITTENGKTIDGCNLTAKFSEASIPSYWCKAQNGTCGSVPLYSEFSCPNNVTIRYQFFDYKEEVAEKDFQRGELTFCEGEKPVEFPKLYYYGRFVSLQNILEDEPITEIRTVWCDTDSKIYREDKEDNKYATKTPVPLTSSHIYDFNTKLVYTLDNSNSSCTVKAMKATDQMPSMEKLVLGEDPKNFIFQKVGKGFDTCRLSNCTHIVGRENTTKAEKKVITMYYDPAHIFSDINRYHIVQPNPVLIRSINKEGHLEDGVNISDIHNYEVANDDWSVFDLTLCKTEEQKHEVSIELAAANGKVNFGLRGLHDELRLMFLKFLKLKQPLRLNNFEVIKKQKTIEVIFTIFDPELSKDADKSLDDIVSEMEKAAKDGTFQIKHFFLVSPSNEDVRNETTLTATSFILRKKGTPAPAPVSVGYTGGTLAGVGLALLLLGLIAGAIAFAFYTRRYPGNRPMRLIP